MTKTLVLAIAATLALSACHGKNYDRDSYFMGHKGGKMYPGDKLSDEGRETYKGGKQ